MFTSRSIDIGVVWPSFEGTWRQWAPKKLLQLLAYAAVCGLIVLLILWLRQVPDNSPHFAYGFSSGVIKFTLLQYAIIVFLLPVVELLFILLIVGCFKLLFDLLESLRYLLSEAIVFGCLLTLSYYQTRKAVFAVTTGLQIFSFGILALSADFDTYLKLWIKSNCSKEGLHFLANFLKLKYFECSNPIEKKVFKTHLFLTTGKLLNATGFQLGKFTELDSSLPRDKVTVTPAGLGHTLFKIEGVSAGILVENSPRLNEQRQILEYLAHNPAACYAKEIQEFRGKYWPDEVHEFRGRYCPIEEYSDLLSSKALYVCRFPQNAAVFGKLERDLGLFSWVGSSERFEKLGRALRFTSRWLFWFARHTGLYSPLESVPLYQKNLYLYGFLGFGLKISLRKYTPGDGVVML